MEEKEENSKQFKHHRDRYELIPRVIDGLESENILLKALYEYPELDPERESSVSDITIETIAANNDKIKRYRAFEKESRDYLINCGITLFEEPISDIRIEVKDENILSRIRHAWQIIRNG